MRGDHHGVILEDAVDPPEHRIPEFVAIRKEYFEETVLPIG